MTLDTTTILIFIVNLGLSALVGFMTAYFRIGEYKNKVDNLETTLGKNEHAGLRKTVGDLSYKVVACETSLKEREPLAKRKSPISLTDRGNNLLNQSGGKEFVDNNFSELHASVEKMTPKTSYDVQEDSREVVGELKEDERINPLKDYLFKDGSSLDDLFFVMSIYLRDKILKEKGWNVGDIDKYEQSSDKQ
jgi:hypothetical protein